MSRDGETQKTSRRCSVHLEEMVYTRDYYCQVSNPTFMHFTVVNNRFF